MEIIGFNNGSIIFINNLIGPHPSITAASSISLGIVEINPYDKNKLRGMFIAA